MTDPTKPLWWAWCKERRGSSPYGEVYYAFQVHQPAGVGGYYGTGDTQNEAYNSLLDDLREWERETSE
jgi:hypothetical protein